LFRTTRAIRPAVHPAPLYPPPEAADMNPIARYLIPALLLLNAVSFAAQPVAPPNLEPLSNFPQTTLNILTPDAHQHAFQIWVADSPARREQGLMFVKGLPDSTGMIFLFNQPQRIQMWMKNTLIPLDMVFIDANGRIDNIAVNAKPLSLSIIDSKSRVLGVLELAGGSTVKLGIHAGDIVQFPYFAAGSGSR
jgi:uncharacterized protein